MTARKKFKRSGKASQKHVRLYRWLTESAAWQGLSTDARASYLVLAGKYDGANNGFIGLGVRELGDQLNISKNSAGRALAQLEDRGFIICMEASSFDRKNRTAREWRLTEHECDRSNQNASKEFMRWQPDKKNHSPTRGTHSPTRDTVALEKEHSVHSQSHQRDRQPTNAPTHSPTSGTHIVNHRRAVNG